MYLFPEQQVVIGGSAGHHLKAHAITYLSHRATYQGHEKSFQQARTGQFFIGG
jgi:hypothetical protein